VKSPDGTQDWIVYHARVADDAPRDVRIQPFIWATDGTPVFGDPLPTGQAAPAPSGVPLVTFIPNLSFERGGRGWLDDFHVVGDAGAIDNDGSTFTTLTGADGKRVGYLGAGDGSRIYQDIGPLHAGQYTLSLELALSSDQAALAAANPTSFFLRLQSVGLHPGGSADESVIQTLAELAIDSAELDDDAFTAFALGALVQDPALVGTWLRVGLYASDGSGFGDSAWAVKLDGMSLNYDGGAAGFSVPEPALVSWVVMTGILFLRRRIP
jgi:hypothetical protein